MVTSAVKVWEEVDPVMSPSAATPKTPPSPPNPGPTVTLLELGTAVQVSLPEVVVPALSVTNDQNPKSLVSST